MTSRRSFVRQSLLAGAALGLPATGVLGSGLRRGYPAAELNLSLAQWSLHRAFEKGTLKAAEFPVLAKGMFGIRAVEYVNSFYKEKVENQQFWLELRQRAESEGVRNLLIMVDEEGELGAPEKKDRNQAIDRHHRWLVAAKLLGCHSIRVNAFGTGSRDQLKPALVDGLGRLAEKGGKLGIHVLVENHGFHTSDASFMVDVIKRVDSAWLGTLPDFGNWCLNREWGSTRAGSCDQSYDPVRGLREFLPYAKGVSAKSYDFDASGNETTLPYNDLLKQVWDSGFAGYIGIEYEGDRLSEPEGVRATKAQIERIWEGRK